MTDAPGATGAPTAPSLADVTAAVERVRPLARRTPTLRAGAGSFGIESDVLLKLECLQHAGSFKVRGAFNTALAVGVPPAGLIAGSGGNHGIAVAHVAQRLGVAAEIFVPEVASVVKLQRIRDLGATVHVAGALYDDAQAACDARASASGALNIHPYDAPLTVAGQATMGVELSEQARGLDTVLVALGGGGLAAGLALALPDDVRLVVVEPERSRCFAAAMEAGEPVTVDVDGVGADSLGAKRVGALPWALLATRAESVTVSDDAIVDARRRLWREAGVAAEHGGAAALAALVSGCYTPTLDERVAVVVCGSNTDPRDLAD